ncbi:NUDIX hydrolase [Streptomyces collinus]|uniref:NUDIX hydrolase n=1 Tax=Streptomyces collinus TaxID=42684 RepID=UPI0037CE7875
MTTETTTEKPGISAAVIVKDGRVLMVRRRRVSESELMWQFPAGQIEPGEAAEDAAVRETVEETGLVVTAIRLLGERVHPQTGRAMSYTACEVVQGEARVVDEEELDAVAWVSHSEITDYVPEPLYEKVQAYLDDVLPH